ncbi:MAG: hypothetical protein HYY61_02315 [Deltaproteobacteria bacterium]|nr:hypothetical protein [Deltaproteobacteria bacterium]
MKRLTLIILALVLSFKLYAADPKTAQYASAGQSAASGGITLAAAIVYWGACGVSGIACVKAALASVASLTSFTMAGLSLDQAKDMDARIDASLMPPEATVPVLQPEETPTPTIRVDDLRNSIKEQEAAAKQLLDQLKTKGYDSGKLIANPESFGISKDQLKQMQSEVAQMASQGKSSEEAMKTIPGESSSVENSGTSRDIATADASVSVSDMEYFNFDTLFSGFMPKGALENSAPGYVPR